MTKGREPFVAPDDVAAAVEFTVETLGDAAAHDWSARAGSLRWDCRRTAVHVADCLIAYAAQLTARPADHWVPYRLYAPKGTSPAGLCELIAASGGILAATVAATPADARAWHPYGVSDPEGFAAMGVTETLIHGADIASGFGVVFAAPRDLCAAALARLFPEIEPADDAWAALRWATGRGALPDHPARRSWRWHAEPLP